MPSLINSEKLNNYMVLGVQVGKLNKGTGYAKLDGTTTNKGLGVWTVRIKFPKQSAIVRTTGVKYSGGEDLNMSAAQYKASKAPTINHFYEKLLLLKDKMNTVSGKKIAQERHEFMEKFLEQFYQEWGGEK